MKKLSKEKGIEVKFCHVNLQGFQHSAVSRVNRTVQKKRKHLIIGSSEGQKLSMCPSFC